MSTSGDGELRPIIVHIDGLVEPHNPGGIGTYAFVVDDGGGKIRKAGYIGQGKGMTNILAEYTGLCEVLGYLLAQKRNTEPIEVYTDLQLIVNQMKGVYKAHSGVYIPKLEEAKRLARKFPKLSFHWVPREENREADKLTREAYRRFLSQGK